MKKARQIPGAEGCGLPLAGVEEPDLAQFVSCFGHMVDQLQERDRVMERQRTALELELAGRQAMNVQLQSAKQSAETANRAKGEFLASISHEIRTPINGILGMTELALESKLSREQREYLLMVRSSAESLLSIVNDILDFSRVDSGKLELERIDFNVYNCIGEMMKSLALRAHQKGLELTYDVRPDVPGNVIGDPCRLRQVLVNLIGNAIKFTEKGEVFLEIAVQTQEDEFLELHFKVTDTGIGIPEDKQDLIFQPFSQADSGLTRRYEGAGLGLAICKHLVEIMGGKLWVESRPGAGSRFHFTARFAHSHVRQENLADATDLRGIPVLIVDDNATNRRILLETTRRWQMRSVAVESGREALQFLRTAAKKGDPFKLLLLDACMPVMDGFQVAEHILRDTILQNPAVLMLTSAGQPGEGARCRDLHISAYLLKPILATDLQDAMCSVLAALRSGNQPEQLITRHTLRESPHAMRILVAEDDAVNQTLIVRILQKMGHIPTVAANGREAAALAMNERFDLVFMDLQMPEMDGIAAMHLLREYEKQGGTHLPIFAITAHAMPADREYCLKAGMDGYIAKPIRFCDIQRVLAGQKRIQPVPLQHQPSVPATWSKEKALERVGGDEQLLRELCQIFLAEYPKLLEKVRDAIASGNSEDLQRAAHSLKGEVSYLGAATATETARLLEDMGRAKDLSRAPQMLLSLEEALTVLHGQIENPASVH